MPFPLYHSTRSTEPLVSFEEALLTGLAPDGGLFIPDRIPDVPPGAWQEAADVGEVGGGVLQPWLGGEVDAEHLAGIAAEAFDFPVPLVPLEGGDAWRGVYVLELFHGPTLSFKDFGARAMARLMNHFLQDRGTSLTILVATSGDTGSAVADGFAGQEHIRVVLLYPEGQVSPTQERQLVVPRPGVVSLAVEGTFDDCQRMVKEAFVDPALTGVTLSSANSINVGRLLPQTVYYFEAQRQYGAGALRFCVPSGNLGNLTAGLLAASSGLETGRFLAAHNANDFFPRHLTEGENVSFRASVRTPSSAMDVGAPSNFERLQTLFSRDDLRKQVWAASVSNGETFTSMRRIYDATGYVADPHTAVGLEAVRRYRARTGDAGPVVVLATAHPAKFPEIVREALDFEPDAPERLAALWDQGRAVTSVPPTRAALREVVLGVPSQES